MKILVVHTWLKGNLGDVLQASVLLRSLRELRPARLDLGGFPSQPGAGAGELVALADRHVPEPFTWYWRYTPAKARSLAIEPKWRRQRTELFSQYDVIVSAPGPFLAEYDLRHLSALLDLEIAAERGIPLVLSSHSIGPLSDGALKSVRRATLCVAREGATHDYLRERGVPSVLSADYAFLYPFREQLSKVKGPSLAAGLGPYRLVFLRSNNLKMEQVRLEGRRLVVSSLETTLEPGERVVLSSSDMKRDGRFLERLALKLSVPYVPCPFVPELVALVAGSTGVISDRYHPVICASALGKPARVVINHEPHKMRGLKALIENNELDGLQDLARKGLASVRHVVERAGAPEQRWAHA